MDEFEDKEMVKKRLFPKSTWYDRLINDIPKPIKK